MNSHATRARAVSPLHARTADLCVTNEWTAQNGFTVPSVFTSSAEEADCMTARVGLCDLSARQCWKVDGPDAAAWLSFATITDVSALEPGQTARTLWCDDEGRVRGEGVVARFGRDNFELATPVRDLGWMLDGIPGFDVTMRNATGSRAVIGLRGPLSPLLLEAAGFAPANPGSGSAGATGEPGSPAPAWRTAQVAISRDPAGDGIDLWTEADDGIIVWDRLWRAGAGLGIAALGAQSLDTLRIERGIPAPLIDWQPAQLAIDMADLRLPGDLGFAPVLSRRFNGADALRRTGNTHPAFRFVLLSAPFRMTPGPLMLRQSPAGQVTSAVWSTTQAQSFAIAWVSTDAARAGVSLSARGTAGPVSCDVVRGLFEAAPNPA